MSEIVRFETLKGAGGKGRGPRDQVAVFTTGRPWLVCGIPRLFFRVDASWREVDSITDTDRGSIRISLAGGVEAIRNRMRYAVEHADDYPQTAERLFAMQHVLRFHFTKKGIKFCCPFCTRKYSRCMDFVRHLERVHQAFPIEWQQQAEGAGLTGWVDRLIEPAEVPAQLDTHADDDDADGEGWKRAA